MSTERVGTRSLAGAATQVTLLAIMLVGIGMLAGWHLHLRALVQIIPGTIAMQYNTALCFLVLGASSWALVAGRGRRRRLPAIGGCFVALIGVVTILEYAAGISLGIDTILFFPWEQTLSIHPGRMALITAISFLSSGAALVLIAFRPGALALFGIAQMLPFSLGVTSVFAYLIGMTSLSIFDLGIQMAIQTALAFVAYSSTMFSHAWRLAPRTEEGLPRWSPAIAIIVAPFFFVGFSVTTQSNSVAARSVQLLISLVSAGLFALAIQKLTKWKIARKGLILISVPLLAPVVFVLAVLALATDIRRNNPQAQSSALQSKEVIVQTQALVRMLVDAEDGIRGYVITGDAAFAQPYHQATQEVPEALIRLQALARDNPDQKASVDSFGTKARARMEIMADVHGLVRAGARDQAVDRVKGGTGKDIMAGFRQEIADFLEQEERLGSARQSTLKESRQRFYWLLVAVASVDLLLTLVLAFLFGTGISRRLSTLINNAQALAAGKELAHPLTGTDEIAHLDRVFHDMAKALEDAAKKERALLENALDVICSVDAEGRFVKVSPACFKLWGYTPEELVGRRYIELVAPEDVEKTGEAAVTIMAGKNVTDFENRYVRKDGSLVCVMWTAFWSENERLMFAVARDITERKHTEDKVNHLNESLQKYALQLEAANEELEAFSYSVSHDLRAPLRHIDGFAGLLKKNGFSALDEKSRRYVTTIAESARQMGRLIDDLLAFSRMGRAEMRRSPVDLELLVNEVRDDLLRETEGRNIVWRIDRLPEVQGDPSMLRLVLMNLLSNAVKYTRGREEAHIQIGSTNGHKDETEFFVRDNGAGFDMTYVDKLFGVFQRLHRPDEFEGTGIGLANVRRIIHRHGGRTRAEGVVDGGATFYFSLAKTKKG